MKHFYISDLIRLMAIIVLINTNTAIGQKAMHVMNAKIMQPYKEPVKKTRDLRIGIGAETYVSENAHGAFYCATINVLKMKPIFSLGPCLQKRSLEVKGIKLGYSVCSHNR